MIGILILLLLFAIPVDLDYRLQIQNGVTGRVRVGWLFGWIRFSVKLGGAKRDKAKRRKKKSAKRQGKKGSSGGGRLILNRDFWRWIRNLLRRLLARVRIYRMFLRVRLGLGDPADTGRLWAVAGPVAAFVAAIPLADIRIEPNFMEAELVIESEGAFRIYPLGLMATVVMTALSPRTWSLFRNA